MRRTTKLHTPRLPPRLRASLRESFRVPFVGFVVVTAAAGCAPQTTYRASAVPYSTPTPRATPTPRPALQPFGDVLSPPEQAVVSGWLSQISAFKETHEVGMRTARIALSSVVLVLQEKRRAFEGTPAPEGFRSAQNWAVRAMNEDIETLTYFMSSNEGGAMASQMVAGLSWDWWTNTFNMAVEQRRGASLRTTPTPTPTP